MLVVKAKDVPELMHCDRIDTSLPCYRRHGLIAIPTIRRPSVEGEIQPHADRFFVRNPTYVGTGAFVGNLYTNAPCFTVPAEPPADKANGFCSTPSSIDRLPNELSGLLLRGVGIYPADLDLQQSIYNTRARTRLCPQESAIKISCTLVGSTRGHSAV